jgi:putative alpha-1,2-mannosidase
VTAELTTTQRTGAHRYTFKRKGTHNINLMTGYLLDKQAKRNSTTLRCGERCLEGSITVLGGFGSRFGGYTTHFHLEWESEGTDKVYLFNDTIIDESLGSVSSQLTGAVIQTNSSLFKIYVGISYVSTKNAYLNLQA